MSYRMIYLEYSALTTDNYKVGSNWSTAFVPLKSIRYDLPAVEYYNHCHQTSMIYL